MGGDATEALTAGDGHHGDEFLVRAYKVLFLAYLATVASFQRDFARLCVWVFKVPIFTGEAAVLVFGALLLTLSLRRRRLPFRMRTFEWLMVSYLAVGVFFTVQGLSRGFGLAVMRDAALVYYASFAFFVLAFTGVGGRVQSLVEVIVGGASVGAVVWTVRFLLSPSLIDGHGVPSFAGILSWIGVVGVMFGPRPTARWRLGARWLALAACSFVVYLSAYRTMVGVFVVTLVVLQLARIRVREQSTAIRPWLMVAWLAVMTSLTASLLLLLPPPPSPLVINGRVSLPHALSVVSHRWLAGGVQGVTAPESVILADGTRRVTRMRNPGSIQGSVVFRKQAWGNALERIRQSPLLGIGFGPPAALFPDSQCEIVSSPLSNCGNAHNTYLTLAMRMGLPVLALFTAVVVLTLARTSRSMLSSPRQPDEFNCALLLLASFVSVATYGLMSLLLESPYLAVLFWTALGGLAAYPTATAAALREQHSGLRLDVVADGIAVANSTDARASEMGRQ